MKYRGISDMQYQFTIILTHITIWTSPWMTICVFVIPQFLSLSRELPSTLTTWLGFSWRNTQNNGIGTSRDDLFVIIDLNEVSRTIISGERQRRPRTGISVTSFVNMKHMSTQ